MKVRVLSGSRADKAPLEEVHEALLGAGHESSFHRIADDPTFDHVSCVGTTVSQAVIEQTDSIGTHEDADDLDLVVLLGDRYEVLGAAVGAYLTGVPIAHLSGGDITEGSADDSMRHAITKLSHVHFTTCRESADRILQMGEEPWRVHAVGCPGVDRVMRTPVIPRKDLLLGLRMEDQDYILVCLHPNTMGGGNQELDAIEDAIVIRPHGLQVVVVGPCRDLGWEAIDTRWKLLADNYKLNYFPSLDQQIYLSLLCHARALVGNSSAGFYEAPCFGTPVINVGDRQQGRVRTTLVSDVPPVSDNIRWALNKITIWQRLHVPHPYGDGHAAEYIARIIGLLPAREELLRKRFVRWPSTPSGKISTGLVSGADTPKKRLSGGRSGTSCPPWLTAPSGGGWLDY